MKRRNIFLLLSFLLAFGIYFLFYHQDKKLKYIPKNADVVVLVDVKKLGRQYIGTFATHPSQWFSHFKKDEESTSIKNSGIVIPDFVQIFHLKNASYSAWNTVLELNDKTKFLAFLKEKKFIKNGKNLYQNQQIFLKIEGDKCWISTSESTVQNLQNLFLQQENSNIFNADRFISNSVASVSYIYDDDIERFSIDIIDDAIEIKNTESIEKFAAILGNLKKKNHFLDLELDQKNITNLAKILNKEEIHSTEINAAKAIVEIEQVNDTIITYRYDDDFNEIEEKSVQKILQPNYSIAMSSLQPEKTWEYFLRKNWINTQNQFTLIPFQPNYISQKNKEIIVKSLRNPVPIQGKINENYIFLRNNASLFSSIKSLSAIEQKVISEIDYVFFGNQSKDYYLKIKLKKEKLPFILRL